MPRLAEELAEVLRAQEVALDLVLQVLLPVEADRAGDVRLGVEGGVLVDLDDADRVVVQVILDPLGVDEDVVGVFGHSSSFIPGIRSAFRYFTFRPLGRPGHALDATGRAGSRASLHHGAGRRQRGAGRRHEAARPCRAVRPARCRRRLVDDAAHRGVHEALEERLEPGAVKIRRPAPEDQEPAHHRHPVRWDMTVPSRSGSATAGRSRPRPWPPGLGAPARAAHGQAVR